MRIWTVANQKGGVGKTTTAVSLGGLLALKRRRCVLVDLDPHGSLTAYFGYDPETVQPSIYDLFDTPGKAPPARALLHDTGVEGLKLIPASTALATLDRQLGSRQGMGLVVQRGLATLEDDFEFAFLDCAPMLGVLMVNALAACGHLLIPVQTEFLALKGLERMIRTLDMVQRSRSRPLPYTIVPTLYDRRTRASVESLKEIRRVYGDKAWEGAIPVDTQFRDASRAGRPLTVMQPWARGSIAYRKLLDTLDTDGADDDRPEVQHG